MWKGGRMEAFLKHKKTSNLPPPPKKEEKGKQDITKRRASSQGYMERGKSCFVAVFLHLELMY